MKGNRFRKPPVKEVHSAKIFSYDSRLFKPQDNTLKGDQEKRKYWDALLRAKNLIEDRQSNITNEEWDCVKTLLVHECEQSREWASVWDLKDDPQRAFDEWYTSSRETLSSLTTSVANLIKLDERNGYDLRNIFFRSAQIALSPKEPSEQWVFDQNLDAGGFSIPSGGPVAEQVELQLLARLFKGRFDEWLLSLQSEINNSHKGFELGRRIGPMWIDPPLTRQMVLRRNGEQLATLALIARLQAFFRRITKEGYVKTPTKPDDLHGDLPEFGKPCWDVIAAFVQTAFPTAPDSSVLKERWSSFHKGRSIRLEKWPEAVQRQASTL